MEEQDTEQAQLERRLLSDVPLQMTRPIEHPDPSSLPFQKKQKLFDKLAKDMEAPTALQEAYLREQLERGFEDSRRQQRAMTEHRERSRGRDPRAKGSKATKGHAADFGIVDVDIFEDDDASAENAALQNDQAPASYETFVAEAFRMDTPDVWFDVLAHDRLWGVDGPYAKVEELTLSLLIK